MSPLRKSAVAWGLAATALAASAIGGTFIYLRNTAYTDAEYVELNISKVVSERGSEFQLEDARKAGYTDKEIATFLSRADALNFERKWSQVATATGILYLIAIIGIAASTLIREARIAAGKGDA